MTKSQNQNFTRHKNNIFHYYGYAILFSTQTSSIMNPICINNYCFDRILLWLQYSPKCPSFVEVAIEVFYPKNLDANGLVMFNHGFLIGDDLLFIPKKILGMFLNDSPLFNKNPSLYYNYTQSIVEKNWAMAFVTASHIESQYVPWTDFGGNPRVGQEAYAAASYLIKYGATNYFKSSSQVEKAKFMSSNNVIFAGHSVGGAHAQAAAVGFEKLQEIGNNSRFHYDPIIYNREALPANTGKLSNWDASDRAQPVGLLQLSPVDMTNSFLQFGMQDYRAALSTINMPNLMIVGQCDCAALQDSTPPAWACNESEKTEFREMAPVGSQSWAVAASVLKGSHCGYLTHNNFLCNQADNQNNCSLCPSGDAYKSVGPEMNFTIDLFKKFISIYPDKAPFDKDFCGWIKSPCLTWLNKDSPDGTIHMGKCNGSYIDYVDKSRCP